MSETEIKLFPLLKSSEIIWNYFSDIEHVAKYLWSAIILRHNFEITSGKFPRAEMKSL